MKYAIKFYVPNDPHFSPWTMIAADTVYENVLTVQETSPFEHDNLFGFEEEPQACEVIVRQEGWEKACIDMSPVFANGKGMYSVPGYKVRSVERIPDEIEG